jgi:hypothetical protein
MELPECRKLWNVTSGSSAFVSSGLNTRFAKSLRSMQRHRPRVAIVSVRSNPCLNTGQEIALEVRLQEEPLALAACGWLPNFSGLAI